MSNSPNGPIQGIKFVPLPDGWTPLSAAMLVKCLDEDGGVTWAYRTTEDMNDEELLGALIVRTDLLRRSLVESFTDPDDE